MDKALAYLSLLTPEDEEFPEKENNRLQLLEGHCKLQPEFDHFLGLVLPLD
jgi:hypothetical protein